MARRRESAIARYAALVAVALLLVLALTAGVAGCMGEEETSEGMVSVVSSPTTESLPTPPEVSEESVAPVEDLSTFESKDPFIQQVVPTTEDQSVSTTGTTGASTSTSYTTTTRYYPTTTTWWTTTTRWSTTTTTKPSSTTTTTKPSTTTTTTKPPYAHSLSILCVEEVGGEPACTFKVDGTIYQDKRVGDVVSTSWGQIQVVDIALSSKVVTLLQGSETVVLEEGETIYG